MKEIPARGAKENHPSGCVFCSGSAGGSDLRHFLQNSNAGACRRRDGEAVPDKFSRENLVEGEIPARGALFDILRIMLYLSH